MRGHYDDRQSRMLAANDLQQLQAAGAGHAHVGDEHVGFGATERCQRAFRLLEGARLHAALPQGFLQHPAN